MIYPFDEMIQLAPAYDLPTTRLLISEKDDPEEMALTLNGRKRKITRADFEKFAHNLGLGEKQLQNIFKRFAKALPGIKPVIDTPFFPHDKKEEFIALIIERSARIGLV